MKKIKVGNMEAKVDDDFHLVSIYKWRIRKHRNTTYAVTSINKRNVPLHQLIVGKIDGLVIDHINGDGLDNRRKNLRHITNRQNVCKAQPHSNKKYSKFKGVTFDKSRNLWTAKITVNYKTINLGRFNSPNDAARAYNKAAKFHFKEFARVNKC